MTFKSKYTSRETFHGLKTNFVDTDETHEIWFPKNSHYMFVLYFITCADAFRSPDDVPADTGYVISAANSKPTGK
jgi:hypothetical protein